MYTKMGCFFLCMMRKIGATFVPDVCLKHLHRRVLVKRHGFYNQFDSLVELCHIAKDL